MPACIVALNPPDSPIAASSTEVGGWTSYGRYSGLCLSLSKPPARLICPRHPRPYQAVARRPSHDRGAQHPPSHCSRRVAVEAYGLDRQVGRRPLEPCADSRVARGCQQGGLQKTPRRTSNLSRYPICPPAGRPCQRSQLLAGVAACHQAANGWSGIHSPSSASNPAISMPRSGADSRVDVTAAAPGGNWSATVEMCRPTRSSASRDLATSG